MDNYNIPAQTRIGHVHLKVADLQRVLAFYQGLLGFELTTMYGNQAAFISAGGYHHHIGLNTWHSEGMPPASREGVGLYHTAIVYPERRDLAAIFKRLREANYPLTGASDHGVSEALYLDDPDGNGVDDTYGLSGLSDYTYCFGAIFQGFGSNPKQIYEVEKGQNVYGGTTEGTKKALAYLADLYQKGYIQADFATQSAAQEREVIAQGKVGIVMGNHAIPTYMINTLHEIDPSVSWRAIVAPTETGEQNRILLSSSINGFIVVNKEFEHPEIAIKMANIVVSALYNSSVGDWWYYDQNASYSLSPFNVFMPAFSNLDTYLELQKAFEADDPSALSAKGQSYWKIMHGDNETSKWAYNSMFGPGEGTSMSVLNTYYQAGDYYWVTFNGQYNDQMNATYSSIGSAMNQIFISIITGQVDLETGWSQWMDTFTKLKGYEILDYVNQWCEENNSYN